MDFLFLNRRLYSKLQQLDGGLSPSRASAGAYYNPRLSPESGAGQAKFFTRLLGEFSPAFCHSLPARTLSSGAIVLGTQMRRNLLV
jgi:hypothetical protein